MNKIVVLTALLLIFGFSNASAQISTQSESLRTWKRGTAIVMFSGLAGGVLGLSTLSFYGEPQNHTSNVTTGALLGMLGGASYLLWESSQTPANWGVTSQVGEPALAFRYRF